MAQEAASASLDLAAKAALAELQGVSFSEGAELQSALAAPPSSQQDRGDRLFVSKVPGHVTKDDLRAHFQQFGELSDVYLPNAPGGGGHKNICFVSFVDPSNMQRAMAHGFHQVGGGQITVDMAAPRAPPPSTVTAAVTAGCRVFLTKVTNDVQRADLFAYFSQYGELSDCYVPPGNKGIAFISFKDPLHASDVLATPNHQVKPGSMVIAAPAFDRPTQGSKGWGGGKGGWAQPALGGPPGGYGGDYGSSGGYGCGSGFGGGMGGCAGGSYPSGPGGACNGCGGNGGTGDGGCSGNGCSGYGGCGSCGGCDGSAGGCGSCGVGGCCDGGSGCSSCGGCSGGGCGGCGGCGCGYSQQPQQQFQQQPMQQFAPQQPQQFQQQPMQQFQQQPMQQFDQQFQQPPMQQFQQPQQQFSQQSTQQFAPQQPMQQQGFGSSDFGAPPQAMGVQAGYGGYQQAPAQRPGPY